jgi:Domain of unknown function (DUF4440)
MITARDIEAEVRAVLGRIEAAWKEKRFDGLDECFDDAAVIVGPNCVVFASGRTACAKSYREFAANAAVLAYSESDHALRLWEGTAVYSYSWRMTYQRDGVPKAEFGTDLLILGMSQHSWRVLYRYINFAPSP